MGGSHRKVIYLGGNSEDTLAADPGCALSFSRGWGPWNVAVLVISLITIILMVGHLLHCIPVCASHWDRRSLGHLISSLTMIGL